MMVRNRLVVPLFALLVAALWAVAAVPQEKAGDDAKQKNFVVTGCLQQETGTESFVLVNAQPSPEAGAEQSTRYVLTPAASVSLKEHVGHRVEVTGTFAKELARTDPGATEAKEAKETTPRIEVTAVKQVAPNCP